MQGSSTRATPVGGQSRQGPTERREANQNSPTNASASATPSSVPVYVRTPWNKTSHILSMSRESPGNSIGGQGNPPGNLIVAATGYQRNEEPDQPDLESVLGGMQGFPNLTNTDGAQRNQNTEDDGYLQPNSRVEQTPPSSPEQLTTTTGSPQVTNNNITTFVSQPGSPPLSPNSNVGYGGKASLVAALGSLLMIYVVKRCFGNGGSVPPSLPGDSFGPPLEPPPMGIDGLWPSFLTSLLTALLAFIGNGIELITKNKIIVGNPNLAVLTTAVAGVYLLRKKGPLALLVFLLYLLAGFLFWKLKLSMPKGMVKLIQGDSTGIMLSSETIILAIAFTVTGTAACIVALVIWIRKKD